uniref:Lipoxygenase domain-containing protein n=1 Tax=Magallana gigas TaxID=29159 RepID=A0A8W8JAN4_MAGGI
MYFGHIHMLKLISILNKKWTYEKNGSIRSSLNLREANEIPGYFFKDDALRLHGAIQQYVSEYTTHYYRNSDLNVLSDQEIQAFREELVRPRSMNEGGGCGMNGIPEFDNLENLVDVLTNFIYICSVEPNFAATLHGHPSDVVIGLNASMPNGKEFFSAISVMKILTLVLTNSLGNYKCTYLKSMDMDGRIFVKNFQQNLQDIRKEIYERNADIIKRNNKNQVQEYTYEWLLPDRVLNSISI